MGKLVEATQIRYYGNRRIRPGEQFVMKDSDFEEMVPELDKDGEPVLEDGVVKMKKSGKEKLPMGVVLVEGGSDYEDPIFETEAEMKAKQTGAPKKRQAVKAKPDDHKQGGDFDVHPELGIQVTGQIRPAAPAASSFVGSDVAGAKPETADKSDKKSGGKSVI